MREFEEQEPEYLSLCHSSCGQYLVPAEAATLIVSTTPDVEHVLCFACPGCDEGVVFPVAGSDVDWRLLNSGANVLFNPLSEEDVGNMTHIGVAHGKLTERDVQAFGDASVSSLSLSAGRQLPGFEL